MIDIDQLTKPIPLSKPMQRLMAIGLAVLGCVLLIATILVLILFAIVCIGDFPPRDPKPPNALVLLVSTAVIGVISAVLLRSAWRLCSSDGPAKSTIAPWFIQSIGCAMLAVPCMQLAGLGGPPRVDWITGGFIVPIGIIWAGHRLRCRSRRLRGDAIEDGAPI
jgi:hypothetical protein